MSLRTYLTTLAGGLLGLVCVATAAPAATAAAAPVQGTDYRLVVPPQNTLSPDKIEVVEFFSYACPHCGAFFPVVNQWLARQPKDVVFRRVPIGFSRPEWINLARAYYALQSTGDLPRLDGALFHAIHEEHQRLFDPQSLADWVTKNGGSGEKFSAAYGSFGINNQTVQADKMAEDFGVDSVPMLAVDGKYVAIADASVGEAQYGKDLLAHTDLLIAKARAEHAAAHAAPKGNARK
jgi:protein dithiol oxidoreductase (disulfide-forming)